MRGFIATMSATVMMTGGLTANAGAATTAAPTNVTVAWADTAHTTMRITWNETGDVPNRVTAEYPDSQSAWFVGAGTPNQLDLSSSSIGGQLVVRIAVYAANGAGNPVGAPGRSVPFDTIQGARPIVDEVRAIPPTRWRMRWHGEALPADPNVGDPMDLPPAPARYQVFLNRRDLNEGEAVTPASTSTEATFQQLSAPPFLGWVSNPNEWGSKFGDLVHFDYERFGRLTVPTVVNYGRPTVISGLLTRLTANCSLFLCGPIETPEPPRLVVLHARTNASSPWYVVGTTRSTTAGSFGFAPTTLGTRQYRVVVPDVYGSLAYGLGVTSGPVVTLAKPRVSGGFVDSTARYGQRVTARVSMAPAANVRTTLQRWDGKAWRDLKWVYTSNGSGAYSFTAVQRGRVAYRFLVPSFTYAGRPLAWQVSPAFALSTS